MTERKTTTACSVDGCSATGRLRGWCGKHYGRWLRHGDPLVVKQIVGDDDARFWSRVNKNGPEGGLVPGACWLWTGKPNDAGYGTLRIGKPPGRLERAHRWLFLREGGVIPDGYELDHLCRTPSCVRPSHLDPVTHRENILRGESPMAQFARRTHCKNGHEYTPANTRATPKGGRLCRTCERTWRKSKAALRVPRSHCRHGHAITPENTYTNGHTGRRSCRACGLARTKAYNQRRRAEAAHA